MDAPQSDVEVRPVVDALQRIDPRLDVLWNARAFVEQRFGFDALGRAIAPTYAGRWQVVLWDTSAKTAEWRAYTLVCTVTAPATDAPPGVHALTHEGPYAPVGPWLVEHIHAIDRANAASVRDISAKLDAAWEKHEQDLALSTAEAMGEACRVQFENAVREGGVAVFHPVGIDLRAPRTTNTPA